MRRSHKDMVKAIAEFIQRIIEDDSRDPKEFFLNELSEFGFHPSSAKKWIELICYIQKEIPTIKLKLVKRSPIVEILPGD